MSSPASAERPIRVLRVIARLNVGGPALHVAYLTEGLAERGYETTLVAGTLAEGEDSMAFVAEQRGVEVVKLDALSREIAPLRDLTAARALSKMIREYRPDIVHTHTAKAGAVGRMAALMAGSARPAIVVHTFHGHVLKGYFGPVRTRAFRMLERWLAKRSTVLIAVSPEVRDDLVALGVAPAERFEIIRLGIELGERVEGGSGARLNGDLGREQRRQLGVPSDRFLVGWVGRMAGVKRVDDVLLAFRALIDRGVDGALCLVGDGPNRRAVERRAHELGIMKRTLFLGYQDDVGPLYSAFDALILPSANEGTPVSVIESLAAGRPVVATRVGGVPDVVREGEDGFLVDAGDVEAMADRLAELARDPALREQMGEHARARVFDRYAVERLVDDVDQLYRRLLNRS